MTPLRTLIVDDEELARVNLRLALGEHPQCQLVGECVSTSAALALLERQQTDLVFLDIAMPNASGLELARQLSNMAGPPLVIFVTAYHVHALEAFAVHALDYLLKPIDDGRLAQTIERASAMLKQRQQAAYASAACSAEAGGVMLDTAPSYPDHLSVRSVGRIERILLDDVFWMSSAGNYVELHLAKRSVLHRLPLGQLERHLDPARYVRVHRGAIARTDQLETLTITRDGHYLLRLRCGVQLAVSERYAAPLRQRMHGLR
jgi:two-component system LytT family response regulator